MMETAPGLDRNRILDGLRNYMDTKSADFDGLEIEITGVFPVYTQMVNQLLKGQRESILIVAAAVFIMPASGTRANGVGAFWASPLTRKAAFEGGIWDMGTLSFLEPRPTLE